MNVVTGGLGFIGNGLGRQLLRSGEKVTVLDSRNCAASQLDDIITARDAEASLIPRNKQFWQ